MKKLIGALIFSFLMLSCLQEGPTEYQMGIMIKNKTKDSLLVILYPKLKYIQGSFYRYSDMGAAVSALNIKIASDDECPLYTSGNQNQKPFAVAAQIFDSIHIKSTNRDYGIIKFTNDTVIGYSENIFDSVSNWEYETRYSSYRWGHERIPIESKDYWFVISSDKYLK